MIKHILLIFCVLCFATLAKANNDNDPFDDLQYIEFCFANAEKSIVDSCNLQNGNIKILNSNPLLITKTESGMPGRMSTFWFTAIISGIGTYTLYGAGAGPVACGIIYVCSDGDRETTKKAVFGCLTGAAIGGLAKWLSVQ